MKYIVEFEDEPCMREDGLNFYKCIQAPWLGLSERVIKQLTPYQPEPDCVSRKTALDAFGLSEKTRKYGGDHSGYDTRMLYEIQDTLEDLPAAQPEIIRCKDCEHRDKYGCCKYWKGLSMGDIPIATDDYDFCSYAKRI